MRVAGKLVTVSPRPVLPRFFLFFIFFVPNGICVFAERVNEVATERGNARSKLA